MKFVLGALFKNPNCLLSRRNRYQLLATILVNISTFSHGLGMGWMAPVMRDLQTDASPFDFDVFVEELSWIGSLLGIGSIIGNLLAGSLQNRIGRKPIMFALAIPYVCYWLLSYFAQSVEYLYFGRLLAGITGGAGYTVFPIFISEISDANIRGRLASMLMLSVNSGVLVGYILATHVEFFLAPFYVIPLPILFFIGTLFLPETPFYLINKGKISAAEKSFRFYKNIRGNDKTAMIEFEEMRMKLTEDKNISSENLKLRDFVTKPALKGFGTALVMIVTNQFTGTFCFTTYLSDIFAQSHTTLDIDMCTIVIGFVQICGTVLATLFCDKFGRKIILMRSTLGASLCSAAFGCYTYCAALYDLTAWGWLPLALLSANILFLHAGLVGIFFVVLVEVMPAKIRSLACSVCVITLSTFVFISLKIFPLCMQYWGISVTLWCSSGFALFGSLYFTFFLVETKGKSMLEA